MEAFKAMPGWETVPSEPPSEISSAQQNVSRDALDDVFVIFFSEAEEDLVVMREALHQLEQGEDIDSTRLISLQHVAHKLQGAAAMMSYHTLAAIASSIERIVEAIITGKIAPLLGVNALVQAVFALETTFNGLVDKGTENDTPHKELEAYLQKLALNLSEPSFVRVDSRQLAQLTHHAEQLASLRAPVEQAQAQLEIALQEWDTVQIHWQNLETELTSFASMLKPVDTHPISSHIAQLLQDVAQQNEIFHPRTLLFRTRLIKPNTEPYQEKPEMEGDKLIRTLKEANANLTTASSHVRTTYTHFSAVLHKYMTYVDTVRSDILLLHSS